MALPLFITRGNKYLFGSMMYAIAYALYYLTNHYPFFHPQPLPLTWVDEATPFLPYSVLIYVSEYIFFALVYICLSSFDTINKYLYSFFILQSVSCFIFVVYPTIYPRELFPVPNDIPNWLQLIWTWLRTQDAATNCFPSLHVSSVFLSAFAFRSDSQRKLFWPFFIWGTFIALSTLPTKQHYVADIVSGFLMALLFYWWFFKRQTYLPIQAWNANLAQAQEE